MAPQKPYPTDLTDKEWALIAPYVPAAKPGGRPEKYPKREILDTIFYILRGGIVNLLTLLLSCTLVRLRHPYTGVAPVSPPIIPVYRQDAPLLACHVSQWSV